MKKNKIGRLTEPTMAMYFIVLLAFSAASFLLERWRPALPRCYLCFTRFAGFTGGKR